MNKQNEFYTLVNALLPGVEFDTRFSNSRERLITIEAPTARVEIYSKNEGDPLNPSWSAPKAKVNTRQSLDGMTAEDVKDLQRIVNSTGLLLDYWTRKFKD